VSGTADRAGAAARLLKVISAYHLVCGAVLGLLPTDLFGFLGIEVPRYWLLYYMLAAASLLAGALLQLAMRRSLLRGGLVVSVAAGNVVACTVFVFFVAWSDLPAILFAPAAASGLFAWLLWGLDDVEVAR
jgi:hypothetical protein